VASFRTRARKSGRREFGQRNQLALTQPLPDQIEISLFGPGYGECCLIHIGSGKWIVIDSCIDPTTKNPMALQYLQQRGFDPSIAVVQIIATHWHDDHVRGISTLLEKCPSADFVLSMAMASKEFITMARSRKQIRLTNVSSGVDEIDKVFYDLHKTGRTATRATADRPVLTLSAADLAHGFPCVTTTLSPSDKQIEISLSDIAELMPDITESEARCVTRGPNNLAVAAWIKIGPIDLLFGADLEETPDPQTGWSVIVNSTNRPAGRACIFKIPHHGSSNGHSDDVWQKLLLANPFAILTPYSKGNQFLPQSGDIDRITNLTNQAYSTSGVKKQRSQTRRLPMVDRTLKEGGITITAAEPPLGHIRLRNGGSQSFSNWTIDLYGPAHSL
jgi:beta-lactamase superfamily II metal-dependent hydrolase